jgi:hypothetical protein
LPNGGAFPESRLDRLWMRACVRRYRDCGFIGMVGA